MTGTIQRNRLRDLLAFHQTRVDALRLALELLGDAMVPAPRAAKALAQAAALDRQRRAVATLDDEPAARPHKKQKRRSPGGHKASERAAQRQRILDVQAQFDLHEPRPRPASVGTMHVAQLTRHGYLKRTARGLFLRTTKVPA